MEPSLSIEELARYLDWCLETGQDTAVSEEAIDRFAAPADVEQAAGRRPAPARAQAQTVPANPPAVASPVAAQDLARSAPTLEALKAAMEGFEGLSTRGRVTRFVFGEGDPAARIMLVSDMPNAEDDEAGRAFAGKAGQLLDRMLKRVGLTRDNVFLTYLQPWRPTGGRANPGDLANSLPFLLRQIELVRPDLILCLGQAPARELLGLDDGILKTRGVWRDWNGPGHAAKGLATLAPDYLLRQRAHKKLAWLDLQMLAGAAAALPPRG